MAQTALDIARNGYGLATLNAGYKARRAMLDQVFDAGDMTDAAYLKHRQLNSDWYAAERASVEAN